MIAGVTLRQRNPNYPCLRVDADVAEVMRCTVEAANCTGVLIRRGSCTIQKCTIQHSKQHGVHVRKYASPTCVRARWALSCLHLVFGCGWFALLSVISGCY